MMKLYNYPLRFLLYLEWILLSIVAFSEAVSIPLYQIPKIPILNLVCVAILGMMGLRLPTGKMLYKVAYTVGEIMLILLASFAGGIMLVPLLYIIIAIRNCFIFERRGTLIIGSLSLSLLLITINYRLQNLNIPANLEMRHRLEFTLLSLTLLFGLAWIFLSLLVKAILSERQSREKLAIANSQLRQYALRIEDIATLQERNRIAREIHDSLGHSLTALNLQLETAIKLLKANPDRAEAFLSEAKKLGSTALKEVRQSVSSLRADPLEGKSLENAIASLAEDFQRTTNICPHCQIQIEYILPADVKNAIYRIVQESLTNICKYAAATEVRIEIITKLNNLYLTVKDNGKGFNLNQNSTGFGLQGMRERTLALGGWFEIDSTPGAGCKIIANFALPISNEK